jgi:hypothetical protein
MSWTTKHSPSSDPKFHHVLMLDGVGRSIRAPFIIFINGCVVRIGLFIMRFVGGAPPRYW